MKKWALHKKVCIYHEEWSRGHEFTLSVSGTKCLHIIILATVSIEFVCRHLPMAPVKKTEKFINLLSNVLKP